MNLSLTQAQQNEVTILMAAIESEYRVIGQEAYDAATVTLESAEDLPEVEIADGDELFTQHGITISGGHDRSAWTLFVAEGTDEDRLESFPIYYGELEGPGVNSYREMLEEWGTAIEGVIQERDNFREELAESIREAEEDN
ncbi:hypothetical protein [Glutamicibacter sp. NPDC087583]|uniref:hypothetical protein n=1 Tax=Glutamicibacter sp. NPDC087583 TaxID=3363995 RepID=UPI00382ADB4A